MAAELGQPRNAPNRDGSSPGVFWGWEAVLTLGLRQEEMIVADGRAGEDEASREKKRSLARQAEKG